MIISSFLVIWLNLILIISWLSTPLNIIWFLSIPFNIFTILSIVVVLPQLSSTVNLTLLLPIFRCSLCSSKNFSSSVLFESFFSVEGWSTSLESWSSRVSENSLPLLESWLDSPSVSKSWLLPLESLELSLFKSPLPELDPPWLSPFELSPLPLILGGVPSLLIFSDGRMLIFIFELSII